MKTRKPLKTPKKTRRPTLTRSRPANRLVSHSAKVKPKTKPPVKTKEPSLLERIARVTDELQLLRSRLANAGDDLPAVGAHRISALETELEKLWEQRRIEQAAPLRQTALSDEEEKDLAFPSGSRVRG